MSSLRFRATGSDGEYEVSTGTPAVVLGTVRKKVERYNLKRPLTVTSWIAFGPDGRRIGEETFWRRRDAAAALEALS